MAIIIESPSAKALRDASAEVRQMAIDIWQASPDQIEAGINNRITDLITARRLLVVLVLVLKSHEERLRTLEKK